MAFAETRCNNNINNIPEEQLTITMHQLNINRCRFVGATHLTLPAHKLNVENSFPATLAATAKRNRSVKRDRRF